MASRQQAAVTTGIGRVAREVLAVGAGLGALIGAASVLANTVIPGGRGVKPEHLVCLSVYCAESVCPGPMPWGGSAESFYCRDRYTNERCFCVENCGCPLNH
jgi:hypothetical protein